MRGLSGILGPFGEKAEFINVVPSVPSPGHLSDALSRPLTRLLDSIVTIAPGEKRFRHRSDAKMRRLMASFSGVTPGNARGKRQQIPTSSCCRTRLFLSNGENR